jgi:hypothetical protein
VAWLAHEEFVDFAEQSEKHNKAPFPWNREGLGMVAK